MLRCQSSQQAAVFPIGNTNAQGSVGCFRWHATGACILHPNTHKAPDTAQYAPILDREEMTLDYVHKWAYDPSIPDRECPRSVVLNFQDSRSGIDFREENSRTKPFDNRQVCPTASLGQQTHAARIGRVGGRWHPLRLGIGAR